MDIQTLDGELPHQISTQVGTRDKVMGIGLLWFRTGRNQSSGLSVELDEQWGKMSGNWLSVDDKMEVIQSIR